MFNLVVFEIELEKILFSQIAESVEHAALLFEDWLDRQGLVSDPYDYYLIPQ